MVHFFIKTDIELEKYPAPTLFNSRVLAIKLLVILMIGFVLVKLWS
jgi:hypothetical protein